MATINAVNDSSAPFAVTGNVTITSGNLLLPTTTSTVGQILINSVAVFHTYGTDNTFGGQTCGNFTTSGTGGNTGFGANALKAATTTYYNTCFGSNAGVKLTDSSSYSNCFFGYAAGASGITNMVGNVAIGTSSLNNATTATGNVAIGNTALYNPATTSYNVAIGDEALKNIGNSSYYNVAIGEGAGSAYNTSECGNICIGGNVIGVAAESHVLRLGRSVSGTYGINKAYIFGIYNVAVGATAGVVLADSVSQIGSISGAAGTVLIGGTKPSFSDSPTVTTMKATTFDTNVAAAKLTIAGTTITAAGSNTDINVTITPKGTGTIVSAAVYTTAVGGTNRAMLVDDSGLIGNATSSRKFKENIQDMGSRSDFIKQLRPVTFTYKGDPTKKEKFGLIAEEVEKVAPGLVSFDEFGAPYSVSYHELPAILLNEIQRAIKRIEVLEQKLGVDHGHH